MAEPSKKTRNPSSEESRKRKREHDRARVKTRVNIGPAFPQWRTLLERTALIQYFTEVVECARTACAPHA
uniref:Uncharacterized protein n=1 Tax=Nothobranchius furzeri TaxID=105023 RepID=A0A8C6P620_NOTFU